MVWHLPNLEPEGKQTREGNNISEDLANFALLCRMTTDLLERNLKEIKNSVSSGNSHVKTLQEINFVVNNLVESGNKFSKRIKSSRTLNTGNKQKNKIPY
jgi:hypothetical protein